MADINKIPRGGVAILTHSLAVYNSADNSLLLNLVTSAFKTHRIWVNRLAIHLQ